MTPHRPAGTEKFFGLPLVFIDIETTGHSVAEGGEICEIGAVKMDPTSSQIMGELDLKLDVTNPRGRSEEELSYHRYNGYSVAEWKNAQPISAALQQLNTFVAGCSPWAYNVSFEYKWLSEYFFVHGDLTWRGDYHWFDLMTMARVILEADLRAGKLEKLSLSSVGMCLGLPEEAKPHRGINGARYEAEVYRCLQERLKKTS